MAIIQKDCHRLLEPGSREDEINGIVPVYVPRLDQQAARRRHEMNGLPAGSRELELDPVVGRGRPDSAGLDAGEIGTLVTIEISDCKCQALANPRSRGALTGWRRGCRAH